MSIDDAGVGVGVVGIDEPLSESFAVSTAPSAPIDHRTAAASARVTDRCGCNNVVYPSDRRKFDRSPFCKSNAISRSVSG